MEKDIIELYTKGNNESFSVGYILDEDKDYIVFLSVDPTGYVDSLQIRNKEYICEEVSKTAYLKMVMFFTEVQKERSIYNPYEISYDNKGDSKSLFESIVTGLNGKIIGVASNDDDDFITGYLIDENNNEIIIQPINSSGIIEKKQRHIKKSDIILVDFLSIENILLEKFMKK